LTVLTGLTGLTVLTGLTALTALTKVEIAAVLVAGNLSIHSVVSRIFKKTLYFSTV